MKVKKFEICFYKTTKSDKFLWENRNQGVFHWDLSFKNEYMGEGLFSNIGLGFILSFGLVFKVDFHILKIA